MHVLIMGWFSFDNMGNTAGDMIARDVVCKWLDDANIAYKVAVTNSFPYPGGVQWETVDPHLFTDILFVCGPFGNGYPITDMLVRFVNCRLIGLDLTILQSLQEWNPFTILYERDSSRNSNPDITFFAPAPRVPVAGVILMDKQDMYGVRDQHQKVNQVVELFIKGRELSVVRIDTELENNKGGLRSSGEVESLIAKMDIVITTRLHGSVLAIKNGVPVIPIDSVKGGAKLTRQIKTIGWPLLFDAENLSEGALHGALDYCLTEKARQEAKKCARKAYNTIEHMRASFLAELIELSNYGEPAMIR